MHLRLARSMSGMTKPFHRYPLYILLDLDTRDRPLWGQSTSVYSAYRTNSSGPPGLKQTGDVANGSSSSKHGGC